ncbi:hypothetical protein [Desulfosediminicola sp.]|uniref:hypothetical protein n=1 Tax=Desulfosediminicola sp. TaxID=2886825 RepID=UPI003AF29B32
MLNTPFKYLTTPRTVFCIFFVVLTMFMTLRDPDYYWHIKTGEYIFENQLLPRLDIFSFTMTNQPWVLHEWLFQLLLYMIFDLFGTTGVKSLSVFLFLVSVYFSYKLSKRLSSARITAMLMLVLLPVLIVIGLSPRPQLFTYIFFSYYLYGLLSYKYLYEVKQLYLFPLIMVLWVNLHGGYIIGIALVFFFAVTELLTNYTKPIILRKARRALLLPFGIALTSLAASSINPDFIDHWKYPLQVISMDASKIFISEWRSPGFHDALGKLYLLLVFTFFAANICRKKRPDLTEFFIPLFFITQGFVAVRHIPLAALATMPFIAVAFKNCIPINLPAESKDKLRQLLSRIFNGSLNKDLGNKEYFMNLAILSLAILALFTVNPSLENKAAAKVNKAVPVTATDFIVDNEIQGRMFNTYGYGGYLIYRLYPDQKVFIDGRADMYGDDFLKKYKKINNGLPDWEKEFDHYDIDYVLCERQAPIRQLLLTRGDFKLVYDDEYSSVLVKDISRFTDLIAEYGKPHGMRIASQ